MDSGCHDGLTSGGKFRPDQQVHPGGFILQR
jgi:hypothetical protein